MSASPHRAAAAADALDRLVLARTREVVDTRVELVAIQTAERATRDRLAATVPPTSGSLGALLAWQHRAQAMTSATQEAAQAVQEAETTLEHARRRELVARVRAAGMRKVALARAAERDQARERATVALIDDVVSARTARLRQAAASESGQR